jgi:hypothetical protein
MFQIARTHTQWPKIRLALNNIGNTTLQLSVAGNHASFPGSINLTDGNRFNANIYYGRIHLNGKLELRNTASKLGEEIISSLDLFCLDPAKYGKAFGDKTGCCMYCAKKLTNPKSVLVGYGPICAANYGLPYNELLMSRCMTHKVDTAVDLDAVILVENCFKLTAVCKALLSEIQFNDLHHMIGQLSHADYVSEYNLLVTALWEHTI